MLMRSDSPRYFGQVDLDDGGNPLAVLAKAGIESRRLRDPFAMVELRLKPDGHRFAGVGQGFVERVAR